jgi:outer membrane protein assembly factor BamA
LKYSIAKISLFILIVTLISACDALKKVPAGKSLLIKNKIIVNKKEVDKEEVVSQIIQQPNSTLLNYKLRLSLYNLAKDKPDSLYKLKYIKNPEKYKRRVVFLSKKQVDRLGKSFWYFGIHNFLKKTGEPPVIYDELKTKKSLNRLKAYYFNNGYFDVDAKFKINNTKKRKNEVIYEVTTGEASFLDNITAEIETSSLDSLYRSIKSKSFLKKGDQYKTENIDAERARITTFFRNHGVFDFQQQSVVFDVDTTTKKTPVKIVVLNQTVKVNDSTKSKPYKIYKIGEVNIFTNDLETKNKAQINDSIKYKDYNIYSTTKLRYRAKAITNAVFIHKDSLFSEEKRSLTLRSLSNLRIFNYPNIKFIEDTITQTIKTNIYLTAKDKYNLRPNVDVTQSNIQDFGIAGGISLSIRNIFRGAEVLEFGYRLNVGSSRQLANPDNRFFNVSEMGADMRLNIPRIFFPLKTESIIPKSMFPSTSISSGFSRQRNIGLDKEIFNAIINYNWTPNRNIFAKLDLINVQYVNNINVNNYFNVYRSSYNSLNNIARLYNNDNSLLDGNGNLTILEGGADAFINKALNNQYPLLSNTNEDYLKIQSIRERKIRLTENNLIFATNFNYSKDTKKDLFDNEFYNFRGKIETAGNILSLAADLTKQPRNEEGTRSIFNLDYSQYVKFELDYIKHWDLYNGKVAAFRSFFGLAIPYGNSKSIPFSRSYFAGGTNDNRAWQSYSLGPGSSGGLNDFNEANMKIAFSLEFRARLLGRFNGAIFADLGNIWNVLDSETDQTKIFSNLKSLQSLALGTGFGLRYDAKFVIIRGDLGFKTYNPSNPEADRWLKDFNFKKSVFNIGINYPF